MAQPIDVKLANQISHETFTNAENCIALEVPEDFLALWRREKD